MDVPVFRFDSVRISDVLGLVVQPSVWFHCSVVGNLSGSLLVPAESGFSYCLKDRFTDTGSDSCDSPVLRFDGVGVLDLRPLVPVLRLVVVRILDLGGGVDGRSDVGQQAAAVHHRLIDQNLEAVVRVQN